MQIDLTPSEVEVLEGLLMNQLHPIAAILNGRETTITIIEVLNKMNAAQSAESN